MAAVTSIPAEARDGEQRTLAVPTHHHLLESNSFCVLLLAGIVVGGMAIRAYRLADRSIWYDESSSWRMSQAPLPELMSRIAINSHPPLYYFVLRMWTELFGDSLWAMRGLSVVLAGVTMVAVYLFVVEAFKIIGDSDQLVHRGQWAGMFAAALVAVSVLHIRAAWDARMYTLGTALLALSSWTLFRALNDTTQSWWNWLAHGLFTVLFMYTHYFALFSVAAQVLFIAGYLLQRNRWNLFPTVRDILFRRALLTYALVAIEWAPWLPVFLQQRAQHEENWWMGPFSISIIPSTCRKLFVATNETSRHYMMDTVLLVAFVLVIAGVLWKARVVDWYAATMACVPLSLCIAASSMGRNVFEVRYLIFAQMYVLVCVALLTSRIRAPAIRNIVAAVILVNAFVVYLDYWNQLAVGEKPGIRGAVAYIEAKKRAGERVIVTSPMVYYPALYHSTERADWRVYNTGAPFPFYAGGALASPEDYILPDQIRKLNTGRVWVVDGWGARRFPVPENWQQVDVQHFEEVFHFQGTVTITEYTVGDASPP